MQPGLKRKQQKLSYLERVGENQADRLERDKVGPLVICKSRVNQIIFPLRASRKLRADVDGGGAGPVRNFVSRRRLSFTARLRNRPQLLQDEPRNQFKGLVNCIFLFGQINSGSSTKLQISFAHLGSTTVCHPPRCAEAANSRWWGSRWQLVNWSSPPIWLLKMLLRTNLTNSMEEPIWL